MVEKTGGSGRHGCKLTWEERVALGTAAVRNGDLHEEQERRPVPFFLHRFSYDAELRDESGTSYRSMRCATHR